MRILHGYLLRTILGTTGLVLAVLLSLGAFITFVGQLNDIVFRIGHLGDLGDLQVIGTLGGVEMGLRAAGIPHKSGGLN